MAVKLAVLGREGPDMAAAGTAAPAAAPADAELAGLEPQAAPEPSGGSPRLGLRQESGHGAPHCTRPSRIFGRTALHPPATLLWRRHAYQATFEKEITSRTCVCFICRLFHLQRWQQCCACPTALQQSRTLNLCRQQILGLLCDLHGHPPAELMAVLRTAVETRKTQLVDAALDCIQKLISHSILTGPVHSINHKREAAGKAAGGRRRPTEDMDDIEGSVSGVMPPQVSC